MEHQLEKSGRETPDSGTTKRRPLLFVATYFLGVIIVTGMITIPYINHPVA